MSNYLQHIDLFIFYENEFEQTASFLKHFFENKELNVYCFADKQDNTDDILSKIKQVDNLLFIFNTEQFTQNNVFKKVFRFAQRYGKRIITLNKKKTDTKKITRLVQKVEPEYRLYFTNESEIAENILQIISIQIDFVKKHTEYLTQALNWEANKFNDNFLLKGISEKEAQSWLKISFDLEKIPCQPSDLHCKFINESKKLAANKQTELFIAYHQSDTLIVAYFMRSISRKGLTVWNYQKADNEGLNKDDSIRKGIIEADNFIFIASKASLKNNELNKQLKQAVDFNKRIFVFAIEQNIGKIPFNFKEKRYYNFYNTYAETERGLKIKRDKWNEQLVDFFDKLEYDKNYYYFHKQILIKAIAWENENYMPSLLLTNDEYEKNKETIKKGFYHSELPFIDLQKQFIEDSDVARVHVFISYGRKHSKNFATKLHNRLVNQGYDVWFDQNNIPLAVDFQEQINSGIEKCDDFVFIISPHSVKSQYCLKEIELAVELNKRIIPILHVDPGEAYNQMHPVIAKLNWVYFLDDQNDFDISYKGLIDALEHQASYVNLHTKILNKAFEWKRKFQEDSFLLTGRNLKEAQKWLKIEFQDEQPPCVPTYWHSEYIGESRKKAEKGLCDAFFSYTTHNNEQVLAFRTQFLTYGVNSWVKQIDAPKDKNIREATLEAIERSRNFIYFISPESVLSPNCRKELRHAVKYRKRIIPILIKKTEHGLVPPSIKVLQSFNFIDKNEEKKQDELKKIIRFINNEKEYFDLHTKILVKSLEWEYQNYKPNLLLHGFELEQASEWLEKNEKRTSYPTIALQKKYIEKSKIARISVFISYGRKHSKDFATKLDKNLTENGFNVWFDQNNIPLGVDFQEQIDRGIENADNFVFVISPHSVKSIYCLKEIVLAVKLHKRIIPLLHVEPSDCWDKMHPVIAKLNWIYFLEGQNDFYESYKGLVKLLKSHSDYVKKHTLILNNAIEWDKNKRSVEKLLVGNERQEAEKWIHQQFPKEEQSPCTPTILHADFICESKKNAYNNTTDVFLTHTENDSEYVEIIRNSLTKNLITSWSEKNDIKTGINYHEAIKIGILQADNILFLLSPEALKSERCQKQLEYYKRYNKRVILVQIKPTNKNDIPETLQNAKIIDFTDALEKQEKQKEDDIENRKEKTLYEKQLDKLFNELSLENDYFHQHKIFLTQAFKWENQNYNQSVLLRGYNLQQAETWLKIGQTRHTYHPIELHRKFIEESRRYSTDFTTEVFISYSRNDADFARKLNANLQTHGKITWFDQESIASGTDFAKEIKNGVENAENFVFIISSKSLKSEYCEQEVQYAVNSSKRIITLLWESIDEAELNTTLAAVQWIDFRPELIDFHAGFGELLRTLDTDKEHIQAHTKWQQRAKEWQISKKSEDLLLRGNELNVAEKWLNDTISLSKKPLNTPLQKEYIQASKELHKRETAKKRKRALWKTISIIVLILLLCISVVLAFIAFNKMDEAIDAKNDAIIEKKKADTLRLRADTLRLKSDTLRIKADSAKLAAEKALRRVKEEQEKTRKALNQAEQAKVKEAMARQEAEKNADLFKKASEEAIKNMKLAEENAQKAQREKDMAMFHLYAFNAKEFANKAIKMPIIDKDSTPVLKAKLALTAYELKQESIKKGEKLGMKIEHDPEVLEALQTAYFLQKGTSDKLLKGEVWEIDIKSRNLVFGNDKNQVTIAQLTKHENGNLPKIKPIHIIENKRFYNDFVHTVATNDISKKLAYGTSSGAIVLYDLTKNQIITETVITDNGQAVTSLVMIDNQIIAGTADSKLIIYDINEQAIKHSIKLYATIRNLIIYKSNIIINNARGDILLVDISNKKKTPDFYSLNQPQFFFNNLTYSQEKDWLIAGTNKGQIITIDVNEPFAQSKLIEFPARHKGMISAIAFSPKNDRMATASLDGTVMVWNLEQTKLSDINKLNPAVLKNSNQIIFSIAFDDNNNFLLFGDNQYLRIRPLNANIAYKLLKTKTNNPKLSDKEWNYYKKGKLEKPK